MYLFWCQQCVTEVEVQKEGLLCPTTKQRSPSHLQRCTTLCALLHAIDQVLDTALALGSLILVDDALGGSLVELAAGGVGSGLCCFLVASLYGYANLLDVGLEFGANRTIADAGLLGSENALLLRFNVCHVLTLSVLYSEASTLRHGLQ